MKQKAAISLSIVVLALAIGLFIYLSTTLSQKLPGGSDSVTKEVESFKHWENLK